MNVLIEKMDNDEERTMKWTMDNVKQKPFVWAGVHAGKSKSVITGLNAMLIAGVADLENHV